MIVNPEVQNNSTMTSTIVSALGTLPPGPVSTAEAVQFVQELKNLLGLP
jgi:hypothetical protein